MQHALCFIFLLTEAFVFQPLLHALCCILVLTEAFVSACSQPEPTAACTVSGDISLSPKQPFRVLMAWTGAVLCNQQPTYPAAAGPVLGDSCISHQQSVRYDAFLPWHGI